MYEIYRLLNINNNILQDFHRQAELVVDHQTDLSVQRSMRKLHDIEEKSNIDGTLSVAPQSIDIIIDKVKQYAHDEKHHYEIFSLPEVRIVSYYMMKFADDKIAYEYAISLLKYSWKDLFLTGLVFHYLESWYLLDHELQTLLEQLIQEKLRIYEGLNKRYILLKNHSNLFEKFGPKRLSAMLKSKKLRLEDAPSFFGNKPSALYQAYYSNVIVQYIREMKDIDLDYIDTIFDVHKLDRTRKLAICALVTMAGMKGDDNIRLSVAKFANRHLGDVTISASWAPFQGATDEEKSMLEDARKQITMWFNRQVIQEFFEVCVQDRERKEFWIDYIQFINDFRIIGSSTVRSNLLSNSRAALFIGRHFRTTEQSNSLTAALVLYIENMVFVEFSDTGALYVYNSTHDIVRRIIKGPRNISNTAQLKATSMSNLIDTNYDYLHLNDDGRLIHSGHWQHRLSIWFERKMNIRPKKVSFNFFGQTYYV